MGSPVHLGPLKSYLPNRKVVFQPSFFRVYVKLRGCTHPKELGRNLDVSTVLSDGTLPETNSRSTWKLIFARLVSFSNAIFSGAMLVFRDGKSSLFQKNLTCLSEYIDWSQHCESSGFSALFGAFPPTWDPSSPLKLQAHQTSSGSRCIDSRLAKSSLRCFSWICRSSSSTKSCKMFEAQTKQTERNFSFMAKNNHWFPLIRPY